jgi:hypothetical protein
MSTAFFAFRTSVLAFLILAGSLGAILVSPARDAGAARPSGGTEFTALAPNVGNGELSSLVGPSGGRLYSHSFPCTYYASGYCFFKSGSTWNAYNVYTCQFYYYSPAYLRWVYNTTLSSC